MSIFDKFRKQTEDKKKRGELVRDAIRDEGDAAIERINAERDTQIGIQHAQHSVRIEASDKRIADIKAGGEKNLNQFYVDHAFNALHRGMFSVIAMSVMREDDAAGALRTLKGEMEERLARLKEDVSSISVAEMREWLLSKAGGKDEKIKALFDEFASNLQKAGLSLE